MSVSFLQRLGQLAHPFWHPREERREDEEDKDVEVVENVSKGYMTYMSPHQEPR
jgi:hypothetical protein